MIEYYPPDICICTAAEDFISMRSKPEFISAENFAASVRLHPNIFGMLGCYYLYFLPIDLKDFTEVERKFIFNGEGIPV